ncbi:hypothetical protein FRC09_004583 [Ceratobasidium sp. 395]|nr:hypothetical protein FRC09_004583 [Ceratobasidium sp. 395]
MIGFTRLTATVAFFLAASASALPKSTVSEARYDYVDNTQLALTASPDTTADFSEYSPEFISSAIQTMANAYLDAHNSFRAQHGARALVWSPALATKAQNWANACVFKHGSVGENLAAGTGNYGAVDAVKGWTDEISTSEFALELVVQSLTRSVEDYDPRNPKPSHFTQVVWKSSTQLGCAVKQCPPGSIFPAKFGVAYYHVCEYAPPGNVIGQFP